MLEGLSFTFHIICIVGLKHRNVKGELPKLDSFNKTNEKLWTLDTKGCFYPFYFYVRVNLMKSFCTQED